MSIAKTILFGIDNTIIPFFGRLCVSNNKYCNVIYYHDIVEGEGFSFMQTNLDVFLSHMKYLVSEGFETLRFDDLNEETLRFKQKRILVAFDDGWLSNYDKIFEFMSDNGIKYNVFLTMGEIGQNPDYLTWDQVREMHGSGLCGFGAHTYTHPDMSDLKKIDFNKEIVEANELFEKELGYTPRDFCYPFGFYSEESNKRLENDTPYLRIYTSKKMYSYMQNGKIVFGRNGVNNSDSIQQFKKRLRGYMNFKGLYEKYVYDPLLSVYHSIRKREQ